MTQDDEIARLKRQLNELQAWIADLNRENEGLRRMLEEHWQAGRRAGVEPAAEAA